MTWTGWVNSAIGGRRPARSFWKQSPHLLQPSIQHPYNIQAREEPELLSETVPNCCYLPGLVPHLLGPGCALAFKHTREVGVGGFVPHGTQYTAPSSQAGLAKPGLGRHSNLALSGRTGVEGC